jgi:peptidoglycan/LPS O-acetylase OafA/YrhL
MNPLPKARVNEIDLLRFVAALTVVFFHYAFRGYAADAMTLMPYPSLALVAKYGYLGVELFFLISGFVILMTAASGTIQSFVTSRILRLYPAFWICCTLTFLATLLMGGTYYSASFSQYLVNLTMLSGFVGVPALDGVYWSLFVELKFYFLVAILLIFRRIQQAQMFLVIWLGLTVAFELLPFKELPVVKLLAYFLIFDYAAYFIAGATYFLVWTRGLSVLRGSILFIAWLTALRQSLNDLPEFELYYHATMNRYVVAGIVSVFFVMMLLVALRKTSFLGNIRWFALGALTYPLYLIHQHLGYMIFNLAYPLINPHVLLWGTLVLMLGAAYTIQLFLEPKVRELLKHSINSLTTLGSSTFQRLKGYWQERI